MRPQDRNHTDLSRVPEYNEPLSKREWIMGIVSMVAFIALIHLAKWLVNLQ